jgi:hypothetical protein
MIEKLLVCTQSSIVEKELLPMIENTFPGITILGLGSERLIYYLRRHKKIPVVVFSCDIRSGIKPHRGELLAGKMRYAGYEGALVYVSIDAKSIEKFKTRLREDNHALHWPVSQEELKKVLKPYVDP